MDKVYVVWESVDKGGYWEDNIYRIFMNKKDADDAVKKLNNFTKVIGDEGYMYLTTSEDVAKEPIDVVGKKIKFSAPLKSNNTPGKVSLFRLRNINAPEIEFIPLKDDCFSVNTKGNFFGVIDFSPEESREQHIERAERLIYDNFDEIVPQWVLDSKDGHDHKHPQGI